MTLPEEVIGLFIEATLARMQALHDEAVASMGEIDTPEERLAASNTLLQAYVRLTAEVSNYRGSTAVELRESNASSLDELATLLSASPADVERMIRAHELLEARRAKEATMPARRPGRPRKLDAEGRAAAQAALDDGQSVQKVASMFLVSRATIYRVLEPKRLRRRSKRHLGPSPMPQTSMSA